MAGEQQERPVYRHIVVKRKDFIEKVASPEEFRRLRQQLDAGVPVDDDLKHLVVDDTLKKTMRKVMGWAGHGGRELEGTDDGVHGDNMLAEADAMAERKDDGPLRYKRQQGVIVARLVQNKIPGGDDVLPTNPTVLSHPGFSDAEDAEQSFMDAALALQAIFTEFSDRKFLLLDKELREGVTLVTVAYTPIMAAPKASTGLDLSCTFHQTTRFGYVDTDTFDVHSEIGEYPIAPPGTMELTMMMKSVDQVLAGSSTGRR